MQKLTDKVLEKIANSSTYIQDTVVNRLADVELEKRIKLIQECVSRLDSLNKDQKKLERNDLIIYVSGQKQESMSKLQYENANKNREKITNLMNALNKALESNIQEDYTKLQELYAKSNNSGNNPQKNSGEAKSESPEDSN